MSDAAPDTAARTGGCLCGEIRFTATGEPDYPHTCSCEHCKKLGGSPVMWWVGFPLESVEWTGKGGEPTWYETFEGEAKRGFCPTCGSRIAAIDRGEPAMGINVTALDEPDGDDLLPVNQSFRDNAVGWLPPVPDTGTAPSADAHRQIGW